MKNKLFLVILCGLIGAVSPVYASSCPVSPAAEAEQGLRIDSELLVIGLTCLKTKGHTEAYQQYQNFVFKHKNLIARYEDDMITHYRARGFADPEGALHKLRTSLVNKVSKEAVRMPSEDFCRKFVSRLDQAVAMDEKKFRRWAQNVPVKQQGDCSQYSTR